jgi:hypothetical protein
VLVTLKKALMSLAKRMLSLVTFINNRINVETANEITRRCKIDFQRATEDFKDYYQDHRNSADDRKYVLDQYDTMKRYAKDLDLTIEQHNNAFADNQIDTLL